MKFLNRIRDKLQESESGDVTVRAWAPYSHPGNRVVLRGLECNSSIPTLKDAEARAKPANHRYRIE
jgi:hypothetical protein